MNNINNHHAFDQLAWAHRKRYNDVDPQFPVDVLLWRDGNIEMSQDEATVYGFVCSGYPILSTEHTDFRLPPRSFFALPMRRHRALLRGGSSTGLLIIRNGYHGVLHVGGPIEDNGRLRYIDGCTDSLLIPPQRYGEPCLNALYFPPGIEQTMHTHPSVRIGIIVDGRGLCETHEGMQHLLPDTAFCINANGPHRFTTPFGEGMRVVAFHPDSDFGPRDEDHPMLNRTIVDGAKAATNIRTPDSVAVEYQQ